MIWHRRRFFERVVLLAKENKKRDNSAYLRTGIIVSIIGFAVKIKIILEGIFISHLVK